MQLNKYPVLIQYSTHGRPSSNVNTDTEMFDAPIY